MKKVLRFGLIGSVLTLFLCVGIVGTVLSYRQTIFTGKAQCGVVFGAGVWKDDRPSHALYDRIKSGIDLYENNQIECLVLSGGPSRYGSHEVDVMKCIILESGIEEKVLFLDYEGVNTQATIEHLPKNIESFVMISNDFHLARIRLLAWKKGVKEVSLHAAVYNRGRYTREPWFVSREIGGILYAAVFVW